jgi:signal transduction histidine kinase
MVTEGGSTKRAAYETARLKLARVRLESGEALAAGLALVTQTVADTMEVDRVGVWFLEDHDRAIVCKEQFARAGRLHTAGTVLRARDFPTYMRALRERRAIVADDAQSHATTRELSESYLRPNRIASLLDAPIIRGGHVIGVVCHERQGDPRAWTAREVDFAGSVGDLLALLLEQADRVELEAALEIQAEQRLERQKFDALALLARSVAHDLNNVLAVFLMAADETRARGLSETADSIAAAVDAGRHLAEQLYDVGGRPQNDVVDTDLGKLLGRLLGSLRALATARVRVVLDLRDAEARVPMREGDVERVAFNLVANARDAITGSDGGETGQVEIVVRRAEPDDDAPPDYVILEVSDDGSGMEGQTRAHLFEPYFTTKASGHGLGLATVYGLVTGAGGSIDVASAPGQGSRFRISLPRVRRTQGNP